MIESDVPYDKSACTQTQLAVCPYCLTDNQIDSIIKKTSNQLIPSHVCTKCEEVFLYETREVTVFTTQPHENYYNTKQTELMTTIANIKRLGGANKEWDTHLLKLEQEIQAIRKNRDTFRN